MRTPFAVRDARRIALWLMAAMLFFAASSASSPVESQDAAQTVSIIVDFGDGTTKTIDNLPWANGNTILDAMTAAAARPHGLSFSYTGSGTNAVMIKIDDVQNQGDGTGKKNWQYWVDGSYGLRSFAAFTLQPHDAVLWRFATQQGQ